MTAPKAKAPMSQEKKDYLKKYREERKEFKSRVLPEQMQVIKKLSKNTVNDREFFVDLLGQVEERTRVNAVLNKIEGEKPQPEPRPDPTKPIPPRNTRAKLPTPTIEDVTPQKYDPRPIPPTAEYEPKTVRTPRPAARRIAKESIEDRLIREALERGELKAEDLIEDEDEYDDYGVEERKRRRSRFSY
jgi:hypothetical protein